MTVSLTHTTVAVGVNNPSKQISKDAWNEAHTITMASGKVLGRATPGDGEAEELATTGSGSVVLATSPTLVTPALGTPSSGVLTNCTGTASGLTAGNVTTNANLTGPITSVGNATSVASQTGTGSTFVMNTSPTLVTPVLGVATATSLNGLTIDPTTGALDVANGATLTVNGSATITGGTHSGTNTGDQTSVSGNASTASALQTARTINGTSFDGTANITVPATEIVTTLTPSAGQNNYSTGATLTNLAYETIIPIAPTNSVVITGILATSAVNGKKITFKNTLSPTASTARMVLFSRESTASSAANRVTYPPYGSIPLMLLPGDSITFVYNTTASRWEYLSGNRSGSPFAIFDNFSDGLNINDFVTTSSGTGAGQAIASGWVGHATRKEIGIFAPRSGTDTTGRCYIGSSAMTHMQAGNGQALFMCRAYPLTLSDGTNTFTATMGFSDAATTGTPVDGVYWKYEQAVTTDWRTAASGSSTETVNTVTGFTVTTTNPDFLGIYLNGDWTNAEFFYSADGVDWTMFATQITSASNNLPTGTGELFGLACGVTKSAGTTSRGMNFDWIGYRYDMVRGT